MSWSEPYTGKKDAGDYDDPPVWRPTTPGEFVEGDVVADRMVDTRIGQRRIVEIRSPDGSEHTVWCGATRLRRGMEDAGVVEGDRIRIDYDGEKDVGKGNPLKLYVVRKWTDVDASVEADAGVVNDVERALDAEPVGASAGSDGLPF